jgi:ABC-type multidrug transport system ATPase subunit
VVLLDEPAGGVNPTLIQHLAARIRDLNRQGTTFLIVEHNMEFVLGLCHQVVVLDYGTVVAAGPPAEVAANPRVLDAYLGAALDDEPATAAPVAERPDGGAADHPRPAAARPDQDPGPGPDPGPDPGGAGE